ncbi:GtrA family protein [Lentzea nigeriaca]|uniref:GtrA family protein n=1 Tax=Lentzea nigeriaca TaxID=1128665 RepID=UPI001958B1B0|nr:GtrA family protein [Lentzea nigeriaca]MBM7857220.1 putative flippase GtrA [Lentzea nigeriaca]
MNQEVDVSVVIPARNAPQKVSEVLTRLGHSIGTSTVEIVFAVDGDDSTTAVRTSAEDAPFPVHLVQTPPGERYGRPFAAVLAGMRAAQGRWIVVMDGDLRHPPELAVPLAEVGRSRDVDLVIATRAPVHNIKNALAKAVFPRRLAQPTDPTSGFFAVRRDAVSLDRLRPGGFRVLMELLVRHPRLRMAEVPYHPQAREEGARTGTLRRGFAFAWHMARLRWSLLMQQTARSAMTSPAAWVMRAVAFGLIGLSGLVVNTAVLWLLHLELQQMHYLIAAVLATEASTSWLFALTELLLYRTGKPGTARSRGVRFFLLNHLALLLRLPLLALLVDGVGINVLVANAFTLGLLFLVRFVVADSAIYGRGEPADSVERPREPMRVVVNIPYEPVVPLQRQNSHHHSPPPTRYLPFRYAIPGIVTIGSQVQLPELEYFRSQWLGHDTEIQIRVGTVGDRRPLSRAVFTHLTTPPAIGYREHLGRLGANFRVGLGDPITVVVSHALAHSPHVVYTNILEALLRFVAVSRGVMLLHSACVELDGVGVLISARTDTGKTGTVLRLVREHNAKFLSDDMTILYPDGRVGCFPKPLTISHHTLRAVQSHELSPKEWRRLRLQSRLHSKEGRQFALVLSQLNLPIMGVNAFTQRMVPPPKYTVDRLLPCEIIPETKVSELFVIERGEFGTGALAEAEAMATLLANTEDAYQFPPFRQLAPSIVVGEDDHAALRRKERLILESAIGRLRARWLSTPDFTWADLIPELVGAEASAGGWV